jgi:medium-chain acyl-[acyl-carrier-protein] hydrolase
VKTIDLWMLSFGGGNETSYVKFGDYLPKEIQMRTFTLPGKGARLKEPALRNIHLIVDEHFEQIKAHVHRPYAIYGHSMGTYVGHLLIHRLREAGLPLPLHAFFTSKVAPSRNTDLKRSFMSDDEFISRLKQLKGMPDAILLNDELLRIFLPTLRNDFYAIDTYRYRAMPPYPVPLSVFCGTEEQVPDDTLTDWQKETTGQFTFRRYPGAHFWIFDHLPDICRHIQHTLLPADA